MKYSILTKKEVVFQMKSKPTAETLIEKLERLCELESLILCLMCSADIAPVDDMNRARKIIDRLSAELCADIDALETNQ
jgi:hypothetical protein